MHYPEIVAKARTLIASETRRADVRALMDDERYPALLSVVLEMEEDMATSVSQYGRTVEERTMDAGGLASLKQFKQILESIATPEETPPEPPPAPGLKKR